MQRKLSAAPGEYTALRQQWPEFETDAAGLADHLGLDDARLEPATAWLKRLDWFNPEPGLWTVGIIVLAHYTNNEYGAGADHIDRLFVDPAGESALDELDTQLRGGLRVVWEIDEQRAHRRQAGLVGGDVLLTQVGAQLLAQQQ